MSSNNSIAPSELLEALIRYKLDALFLRSLDEVSQSFLLATGREGLTGIRYPVLCLLVAQAMENAMAGYSGRSNPDARYFHEAVGYQLGNTEEVATHDRYYGLTYTVGKLQHENEKFAIEINNLLEKFK